ncbi:MAG: SAM-dependent DNA methyltransferase [Burkholderiales bacterium]|nr:SAM-dependent DNA methyltransferase [Burkholderiales bacterium]
MEPQKQVIEIKKLEQFLSNIKVLNELNQKSPRMNVLKSYSGFGGLRQCFNSKQLYGMLMRELRGLFGRKREHEIFNSLRHSCKSGYYTPKEVVKFMYRYLIEVCNFKGGDILEPSCGNGAFFEHMPGSIKANSAITGIEMDTLTSRLTESIYPDIKIINQPLQDVDFTNKKYDLIIGNPPYSDEKVMDSLMPDISNYTIHHYFVAKCVRLLKDNGILALVLPSFYLDIPRRNTRAIVNNEAVLIDVVRLPDNLFAQATVTVDIIFIRKTGNKVHNFVNTVLLEEDGKKDSINEYWQARPQRILGELKLKWVECYNRHVPTCMAPDAQLVINRLVNSKFSQDTINNYGMVSG